MRRILSTLIVVAVLIAVMVMGTPFSVNANATRVQLGEKILSGRCLYFSGGSEQTRKYLYSKLDAAQTVFFNENAKSSQITASYNQLKKAIEDFVPITLDKKVEINAIRYWSAEQISAMQLKGATAELINDSDKQNVSLKLTLTGEKGEFFNKPGEDGAYSPFATDMNFSDGLAFWVSANEYSKVSSIDFYVGTRSAEKDELLSVDNIPIEKEGYVYIPWEAFYPEKSSPEASVNLNGCMNRLGIIVNGRKGAEVYISDIHAFVEQIEEDRRTYEEVKINTLDELKNDGLYKLVDSGSGRVVTFGPEHTETQYRSETRIAHIEEGQSFTLDENKGNSVTQQWQIYKLAKSGKYHIINQGTAAAMTKELSELVLQMNLDLDEENQRFEVYVNDGKFTFRIKDRYLGISEGVPALVSQEYSQWLVYECVTDQWVEVWSDEFNGKKLDRTKWNVTDGKIRGDTEPVTFRDDPNNFYLQEGNLVIRSVVEEYGGYHATAAYMDTRGLFSTTYGKLEMRAKLTYGSRVWPAFWAMGAWGNWPYNGEIDIMEFDGDGGTGELEYSIYATNHWFNFDRFTHAAKGITLKNEDDEPFSEDYHIFTVEWDETQIRTYLDGMLYMSMMLSTDELRWSFGDNPHYLILNTSMKGPGDNQLYEDTVAESFYYIDYVRCYKRSSEVAQVPAYNDKLVKGEFVVSTDGWMTCAQASSDGGQVIAAARSGFYVIDSNINTIDNYVTVGGSEICKIKYSADGARFAVADRTGIVNVYDRYSLELLASLNVPTLYVEGMEFSRDGKYIYFGGSLNAEVIAEPTEENYALSVYRGNLETQEVDASYLTSSNVRELALSPNGKLLVAGCANGKVFLFDVTTGFELVSEYENHIHCVRGISWSSDGKRFSTSDEDGRIFIYDVEEREIFPAKVVNTSTARILSYSPDGKKLLAAGSGESARIFDGTTGELLSVFGGFSQYISVAQWSSDGKYILLMSGDGYGRIFDSSGNYICTLDGRLDGCSTFVGGAFANGNSMVYAVTSAPRAETYCWNISEYISDDGDFRKAYTQALEAHFFDYTAENYRELSELCDKYEKLFRSPNNTQKQLDTAVKKLKKALDNKNGRVLAYNSRIFARVGE